VASARGGLRRTADGARLTRAADGALLAGGSRAVVAGSRLAGLQVAAIQRSRLLAAAVGAIDERGYPDTSVAHITARSRVSRRTFYELFANREEYLAAVLEDVLGLIEGELAAAGLEGLVWRERVRMGLWVILSCLDREPALARVCIVQATHGGPAVLERLSNPFLGDNCYIGSASNPIVLKLTVGTTSPPPPNKPITGHLAFSGGDGFFRFKGVLVDNMFAMPAATGCGGSISPLVDRAVNTQLGLPSAAGHNTQILNATIMIASASEVKERE
jgi:AcrR family transcriptional regulator